MPREITLKRLERRTATSTFYILFFVVYVPPQGLCDPSKAAQLRTSLRKESGQKVSPKSQVVSQFREARKPLLRQRYSPHAIPHTPHTNVPRSHTVCGQNEDIDGEKSLSELRPGCHEWVSTGAQRIAHVVCVHPSFFASGSPFFHICRRPRTMPLFRSCVSCATVQTSAHA